MASTKRLTHEEATRHLNDAAAALSTLADETVPVRVERVARMVDAVVGQAMARLGAAKVSGQDPALAIAAVTGAVRVIASSVPTLRAMPEAAPYRSEVEALAEALGAFCAGAAGRVAA